MTLTARVAPALKTSLVCPVTAAVRLVKLDARPRSRRAWLAMAMRLRATAITVLLTEGDEYGAGLLADAADVCSARAHAIASMEGN